MGNPAVLMENIRSFTKSRIILTAAELDLFTLIQQDVNTVKALAEKKQLNTHGLTRVLDALVVFGLLTKENGHYKLMEDAKFLSADHPESVLPMVLHMNSLWDTWGGLTDTVKTGKNPVKAYGPQKPAGAWTAFIGAMHVVGRKLSKEIAAAVDLSAYHKLLDIGGASGTYTIAFLEKNPDMKAVIFDLANVIPLAKERLKEVGILGRVELVEGDFYKDELPTGCDLALLSAIIHQNSPDQNVGLFGKIHRALVSGGTIMIRDHIMDENRTYPPAGTTFAINMLVGTESGDTYTFREVKEGLETVGFTDIKQIKAGEKMDCIVTARKPG